MPQYAEYADYFCLIYWHADVTNIDKKLNETAVTGLLIINLVLTLVIIILSSFILCRERRAQDFFKLNIAFKAWS